MISVIVLSKNNGDTLDACLKSIIDSFGDKEIIVVDAVSTDNTPKILEKYKGKIKVVYDKGKGIGIARNIGVSHSNGEIICFVDADAICAKNHFVKIKEYFDEHPNTGIINVVPEEKISGEIPYVQKLEAQIRLIRRMERSIVGGSLLATGYFMAFRRKVYNDVNGFWEFPPFGADDNDFTLRALAKGWKFASIKLESWHRHRPTLRALLKEMWMLGKGKACFIAKWRNHPLIKVGYKHSLLTRLLGTDPIYLTIVAHVFSPFIGLKYAIRGKSLSLIPFYIVRQYTYLLGFLWGLGTWAKKL
ncbi:MAG: glycosyltransferase [Candidatus Bathyarchaeia archaeon]